VHGTIVPNTISFTVVFKERNMRKRKKFFVALLSVFVTLALVVVVGVQPQGVSADIGLNVVYSGALSFGDDDCDWFTSDGDVFASNENDGCHNGMWDDNGWLMMDIPDEEDVDNAATFFFEVVRDTTADWQVCGYVREKAYSLWVGCCVGRDGSECETELPTCYNPTCDYDYIKISAKNDQGGSPDVVHVIEHVIFSWDPP
jgi:hypothetical protein